MPRLTRKRKIHKGGNRKDQHIGVLISQASLNHTNPEFKGAPYVVIIPEQFNKNNTKLYAYGGSAEVAVNNARSKKFTTRGIEATDKYTGVALSAARIMSKNISENSQPYVLDNGSAQLLYGESPAHVTATTNLQKSQRGLPRANSARRGSALGPATEAELAAARAADRAARAARAAAAVPAPGPATAATAAAPAAAPAATAATPAEEASLAAEEARAADALAAARAASAAAEANLAVTREEVARDRRVIDMLRDGRGRERIDARAPPPHLRPWLPADAADAAAAAPDAAAPADAAAEAAAAAPAPAPATTPAERAAAAAAATAAARNAGAAANARAATARNARAAANARAANATAAARAANERLAAIRAARAAPAAPGPP